MRRTNIMLEFSDEVYDILVEPMKKNKSFSKLLASLVEGYLNDGYIRAYADDTLEDMRKAAVSSFSQSIDAMTESLSNMGLFADELESASLSGKTKFKAKAEKQAEELSREDIPKKVNSSVDSVEIGKIQQRITDIESSIDSKFNQVFDMLKGILEKGIVQQEVIETKAQEKVTNDTKVENVKTIGENVKKDTLDDSIFNDIQDSDEDIDEANNFMLSMLEGNSFEF